MVEKLKYLTKIIPDQLDILIRRYHILMAILQNQPAGRRSLSQNMNLSERLVRTETEHLSSCGLITISKTGMSITTLGIDVLKGLEPLVYQISGISKLEEQLCSLLNIKSVSIVSGDCQEQEGIKKLLGSTAANLMLKYATMNSTIALTGGSTMACMVDSICVSTVKRARLIVPARGSVGRKVEQQSDTLVSKLAHSLNAQYRLLNIPDSMSTKAMNEIKNEKEIQETLMAMQMADILVFGIGEALTMAHKRGVSDTIYDFLIRKEAVGEAFGYYFNKEGEIVYSSRSIGINLEDVKKIPHVIAVAGGKKKASSIIAICKVLSEIQIVVDEGAAKEIMKLLRE